MSQRAVKLILFLLIIIGVVLFSLGILFDVVLQVFLGIIISVIGIFGFSIMRYYFMFNQVEDVYETLSKYDDLHLAICSECGKENILEDRYCVKCGNKLEEITKKKIDETLI